MARFTFKKRAFAYPTKETFHSRDCELTAIMRWVIILKSWLNMFNSFFFPFSFLHCLSTLLFPFLFT